MAIIELEKKSDILEIHKCVTEGTYKMYADAQIYLSPIQKIHYVYKTSGALVCDANIDRKYWIAQGYEEDIEIFYCPYCGIMLE